jgi:hypothetical protein
MKALVGFTCHPGFWTWSRGIANGERRSPSCDVSLPEFSSFVRSRFALGVAFWLRMPTPDTTGSAFPLHAIATVGVQKGGKRLSSCGHRVAPIVTTSSGYGTAISDYGCRREVHSVQGGWHSIICSDEET